MKVVIAPDKFKGSLAANEVVEAIAAGIRDVVGDRVRIVSLPVADGGEGTVEAAISHTLRNLSCGVPLTRSTISGAYAA